MKSAKTLLLEKLLLYGSLTQKWNKCTAICKFFTNLKFKKCNGNFWCTPAGLRTHTSVLMNGTIKTLESACHRTKQPEQKPIVKTSAGE